MKYMALIYVNPEARAAMSEAEQQKMFSGYFTFNDEAGKAGVLVLGDSLDPVNTARTVRVREGKALHTDGPFAETKEYLGGYYILDCSDIDEALAWAAKIPDAQYGSVEVRPITVIPGNDAGA